MVAGIVIGLIVGVAVAVGLAMYLNKSSTPFSNLEKLDRKTAGASAPPTELLAPGTRIADAASETAVTPAPAVKPAQEPTAPPPMPAEVPVKPAAPAAKDAGKDEQRFDFYKILPGQVDAVPGKNGKATEPSNPPAAKKVYLQLGSFQNQDEADNLKAKLALLGIKAKIQSITVPEKGLVHRVRVGPYSRQDEVDRVKAQLKQDGIGATVVKAE